jgi:hypothetical protein
MFLCGMTATPARAVDPTLQVSYDAQAKPKDAGSFLQLRPNVVQPVFLAVHNPDANKKKRVFVELVVNGKSVEGGKSAPLTVKPGATEKVRLAPPAPKKKGKPEEKGKAAKGPEWKPVAGPPFRFEIRLYEIVPNRANKLLQKVTVKGFQMPQQYADAASVYDSRKGLLTVVMTARGNFFGPECTTRLELPRDRLPDFADSQDGEFERDLAKPGDRKELYVKKLYFRPGSLRGTTQGDIYVTVDGFRRAFIFHHDLAPKDSPDTGSPVTTPAVRLQAPPVIVLGTKLAFPLQVDYTPQEVGGVAGPAPDEVTLEVSVFRDSSKGDLQFRKKLPAPGHRKHELAFALGGPDGALLLKTGERDWTLADLDTKKIQGKLGERFLQIRLLDKQGKVVTWLDKNNRRQKLEYAKTVTFVKGLGGLVAFIKKPSRALFGQDLALEARSKNPDLRLSEVAMFLGKPPADGKVPPTAEEAVPGKGATWAAELTLPEAGKKKVVVSLVAKGQFADGVMHTLTDSFTLRLAKPKVKKPKKDPMFGTIKGKVMLGGRLEQVGVKVLLAPAGDHKKEDEKTKETNKKGAFVFKKLKPGKYKVSSVKNEDAHVKGDKEVEVKAGETAKVTIDITYKP